MAICSALEDDPAVRSIVDAGIGRSVAEETQFGSGHAFQGSGGTTLLLHTVRGRNDERYDKRACVTDQRGFRSVFCAVSRISHCLVPSLRRDGCVSTPARLLLLQTTGKSRVSGRERGGKRRAVVTKRKMIGTIENNRLLCLGWRVCVLVHTSASLQNAGQYSTAFKDSQQPLRSLFSFSLSLSPFTLTPTLSLPRPSTPATDIILYIRIGVDQLLPSAAALCHSSSPILVE